MAVEVHVEGVIERGRFAEFLEAAERWRQFRRQRGWAEPRLLCGLSGAMNTVRLIFRYPSLADFERQDAAEARDTEYAKVAMAMPFEARIEYTIFREEEAKSP